MPKKSRRNNVTSLNRGLREIQAPSHQATDEEAVDALMVPTLEGNNLPQIGIDLACELAPHVPMRQAFVKEILKNTQAETEAFQRIAKLTKESREAVEATEKAMTPPKN